MSIFHLGDSTAGPGPGLRLVTERGEETLFSPRFLVLSLRSVKYEEVYLHDYADVREAREGLRKY